MQTDGQTDHIRLPAVPLFSQPQRVSEEESQGGLNLKPFPLSLPLFLTARAPSLASRESALTASLSGYTVVDEISTKQHMNQSYMYTVCPQKLHLSPVHSMSSVCTVKQKRIFPGKFGNTNLTFREYSSFIKKSLQSKLFLVLRSAIIIESERNRRAAAFLFLSLYHIRCCRRFHVHPTAPYLHKT